MPDEPDNLVLQLLRDIRAKLDEQAAKLDQLQIDMRTVKGSLRFAVGSAGVAEHQSLRALQTAESALRQVEELKARIETGSQPDV